MKQKLKKIVCLLGFNDACAKKYGVVKWHGYKKEKQKIAKMFFTIETFTLN